MKVVQRNIFIFILIILINTTQITIAQSETTFRKLRTSISNRFSRLKRTVSQNSEPDVIAAGLALATVIFVPGAWYQARFKKKKSKHIKPDDENKSFREVMNEKSDGKNNDSVLKTMAKSDGSFKNTTPKKQPKSPDITLSNKAREKKLNTPDININQSNQDKITMQQIIDMVGKNRTKVLSRQCGQRVANWLQRAEESDLFRQDLESAIKNAQIKQTQAPNPDQVKTFDLELITQALHNSSTPDLSNLPINALIEEIDTQFDKGNSVTELLCIFWQIVASTKKQIELTKNEWNILHNLGVDVPATQEIIRFRSNPVNEYLGQYYVTLRNLNMSGHQLQTT